MPRAVLDSSVLVSPFVAPNGVVARLLHSPLRGRYRLCLSEPLLAELADVLLRKASIRRYAAYGDIEVHDYLRWLIGQAEMISSLPKLQVVEGDPKDDMVIATAVAAKADYLVTGDRRHLLPIGSYGSVRIVTPRAFLDCLQSSSVES